LVVLRAFVPAATGFVAALATGAPPNSSAIV
jgi:hypothetical protein